MAADRGALSSLKIAEPVLSTLTPATARDNATLSALRHASWLMTEAITKRFSSDAALNDLRHEALNKLSKVAGSLDAGTLTQDMIERARQAVASLLAQYPP